MTNNNVRVLPYNYFAERMVLNSILTNPMAIDLVSQRLTIEAFSLQSHRIIYKAILALYSENKPIDYVTVVTWLQDHNYHTIIKLSAVREIVDDYAPSVSLNEYVGLVYEKYLRRCLVLLGIELVEYGYQTNCSLDKIFGEVEQKFLSIANKKQIQGFSTSEEILNSVLNEIREKLITPRLPGLMSMFYDIDIVLQGFRKSDLIVLAGRPSMGKTALALTFACNIAKRTKTTIAIFSLEMTKQQLMYRLLSSETNISHSRLKAGRVSESEWVKLNKTIKFLSALPLFIDDSTKLSVSQIRLKLKLLKRQEKENLGLVIIDYLQLLESEKSENRVQEISKITRTLKSLAKEFAIPIIVLSQLSRNVENRPNKRPVLSDLRDSGSIEQDADVVILLYRDEYYNEKTIDKKILELIIAKHRNGRVGSARLRFTPEYLSFSNL